MDLRSCSFPLAATVVVIPVLCSSLLIGGSSAFQAAGAADSAFSAGNTPQATKHFDVQTFEQYVRVHHRRLIPYADRSGHIFQFAAAWMQHRAVCGGALTGVQINMATLSSIQSFQGCWAQRLVGQSRIRFHSEAWIR